jgi:hypothetical protein
MSTHKQKEIFEKYIMSKFLLDKSFYLNAEFIEIRELCMTYTTHAVYLESPILLGTQEDIGSYFFFHSGLKLQFTFTVFSNPIVMP